LEFPNHSYVLWYRELHCTKVHRYCDTGSGSEGRESEVYYSTEYNEEDARNRGK
jgi:hypothetical protein